MLNVVRKRKQKGKKRKTKILNRCPVTNKVSYKTFEEAFNSLDAFKIIYNIRYLRVYKCDKCNQYHITSKKYKKDKR